MPLGHGYVELGGSIVRSRGPEAWLEGGYKPLPNVGLFGRGFINREDLGVMAGVRIEF